MRCLLCTDNLPCKFHGQSDYDRGYKDGHQSATEQMKPLVEAAKAIQQYAEHHDMRYEDGVTFKPVAMVLIHDMIKALATIEQQEITRKHNQATGG